MGKYLIIEAWAKYRPSSEVISASGVGDMSPKSPKKKDINEIYGEGFL
jgi:hypothetical protein